MLTGVLNDGTLHPEDITAGLIHLAQRGFIKIRRTEKKILFFTTDDHEVTLLRPISEAKGYFDAQLLRLIFESDAAVGTTVELSTLSSNVSQGRANRRILRDLKKRALVDLEDAGFFESHSTKDMLTGGAGVVLGGAISVISFRADVPLAVLGGLMIASAALAWLIAHRRRTRKGYDALHHLEGFSDYLSTTGKDRFEFHNAPEKDPRTFLEYLPYAIAFGVEEEWAEVFSDVTMPDPEWYDGSGASFSAHTFAKDIGSFSRSFESSSGASASSGGGSAGGGVGGGGGGSW